MAESSLRVWVLNGPNLNMLGMREPGIYGATTLGEIEATLVHRGLAMGAVVTCRQSNHEGLLIDWIQAAALEGVEGLVVNAGALTHSSIGLRDALALFAGVKIEVHLSNVWKREAFRHHSTISEVVDGVIAGLGPDGYGLALQAVVKLAHRRSAEGTP